MHMPKAYMMLVTIVGAPERLTDLPAMQHVTDCITEGIQLDVTVRSTVAVTYITTLE